MTAFFPTDPLSLSDLANVKNFDEAPPNIAYGFKREGDAFGPSLAGTGGAAGVAPDKGLEIASGLGIKKDGYSLETNVAGLSLPVLDGLQRTSDGVSVKARGELSTISGSVEINLGNGLVIKNEKLEPDIGLGLTLEPELNIKTSGGLATTPAGLEVVKGNVFTENGFTGKRTFVSTAYILGGISSSSLVFDIPVLPTNFFSSEDFIIGSFCPFDRTAAGGVTITTSVRINGLLYSDSTQFRISGGTKQGLYVWAPFKRNLTDDVTDLRVTIVTSSNSPIDNGGFVEITEFDELID